MLTGELRAVNEERPMGDGATSSHAAWGLD
jgi:hypothetical protein